MAKLTKKALDGNVETIILSELLDGANYGYALVREINEKHEGLLKFGEGTIYPVLYRMEEKGLLTSMVRKGPSGRDRKYYQVSDKGRRVLGENLAEWALLSKVMGKIQDGLPGGKPAYERAGILSFLNHQDTKNTKGTCPKATTSPNAGKLPQVNGLSALCGFVVHLKRSAANLQTREASPCIA